MQDAIASIRNMLVHGEVKVESWLESDAVYHIYKEQNIVLIHHNSVVEIYKVHLSENGKDFYENGYKIFIGSDLH